MVQATSRDTEPSGNQGRLNGEVCPPFGRSRLPSASETGQGAEYENAFGERLYRRTPTTQSNPGRVSASQDGRAILVSDIDPEDILAAENDARLIESANEMWKLATATLERPGGTLSVSEWRGTAKNLADALHDVIDIAMVS